MSGAAARTRYLRKKANINSRYNKRKRVEVVKNLKKVITDCQRIYRIEEIPKVGKYKKPYIECCRRDL